LHRVRERLVSQRTGIINQIRAFLLERGIAVRQGQRFLRAELPRILATPSDVLSPRMLHLIENLAGDWRRLDERIDGLSGEIEAIARQDAGCERLMSVPGIGPIISSAMVAAIGTGDAFSKGRDFAAWLGLVPKQISTGDRTILGKISKRGNRYLRVLFVHEAPRIADMNGDFRDGLGSLPMSNTPARRGSTAMSYLDTSVRARKNLTIMTGATVTRFLFDGRRVSGVSAVVDGASRDFRGAEILLCAGAIHSPAFLLRAGVGPAAELRALGIDVVADLRGVGRNLQNHPLLFLAAHLRRGARQQKTLRPHPMTCLRYSSGMPATPPSDMYIAAHSKSSWSALGAQIANFNATIFKPASRGRVTLVSPDLARRPRIEFNFVGEKIDLLRLMDGFRRIVALVSSDPVRVLCTTVFPVRFTDRIRQLNQLNRMNAIKATIIAGALDAVPALADTVFGRLTGRRVDLAGLANDNAALADYVRNNVAGTFHVCGTCRMGRADDPDAVVDNSGRVRGISGLRVVDASIMPAIPRGNTNIPTVMLAEKVAADMCAERARGAGNSPL
jgi:choline dehydrogenase-like flavoprotein